MKRRFVRIMVFSTVCMLLLTHYVTSQNIGMSHQYRKGTETGKMVDAGFLYGDSNYHAIIQASDGNVYYVICSHNTKSGAHMFRYDPLTDRVKTISDLTVEVCEDRTVKVNQGKVHSDIFEADGKQYFATHAGSYESGALSCAILADIILKSETFIDYGIGPAKEGLVAMYMNTDCMRMCGITWPGYRFTK